MAREKTLRIKVKDATEAENIERALNDTATRAVVNIVGAFAPVGQFGSDESPDFRKRHDERGRRARSSSNDRRSARGRGVKGTAVTRSRQSAGADRSPLLGGRLPRVFCGGCPVTSRLATAR